MQSFEFPRGIVREYIAAIDIAAIMVLRVGERVVVKATRDPEKTLVAMPGAIVVAAWWVRNRDIAKAVAKIASGEELAYLDAVIQHESQRQGSVAVSHGVAMERMRNAGDQIDAALRAANAAGGLSWFNRAYRQHRLQGSGMAYQSALARLRRAIVRRLVMHGRLEMDAGLLSEVFGGPGKPGQDTAARP